MNIVKPHKNITARRLLLDFYQFIRSQSVMVRIKSTVKTSPVNLFRPFNMAPADTWYNRFSDYSCGCRIIEDCGLGLTPSGYYVCAVAGGIDRVFGFGLGRETLPPPDDTMVDQMKIFCRLCGHFGFAWPVKTEKISPAWRRAYAKKSKDLPGD